MGQGASYQQYDHHYHHHHSLQQAMDPSLDPPSSPQQVRQRVQQQQQRQQQQDRQELDVGSLSGGCCGGGSCSCGGGLASTAAIYGTASVPDPGAHAVVVTPPRSLPHHHHHHTAPAAPSTSSRCGGGGGCGHWCANCRVRVQLEVECVGGVEARPSPSRGGRLRTLAFPRRHRHKAKTPTRDLPTQPKKKKTPWTLRLNCRLRPSKSETEAEAGASVGCAGCMCPTLPRPDPDPHPHTLHHHHHIHHGHSPAQDMGGAGAVATGAPSPGGAVALRAPVIDLARFNPENYPIEDWEERARQERAREMAEGVEPPPGFLSAPPGGLTPAQLTPALTHLQLQHQHQVQLQQAGAVASLPLPYNSVLDLQLLLERSLRLGLGGPVTGVRGGGMASALSEETLLQQMGRLTGDGSLLQRTVHTQVDYIHCLVPDLLSITNCVFYWGKMDRYEAERLLDNRPEGTFLLRDSAQEEYLFSVSFRRYGRSLHARIEQWNHKFSFDSHDPGVFASDTVCGLIEHYKDPSCCMFFEPMLTNPLARTFPFPLQHLCRAVICSATTYDGINNLRLPKRLNNYLKEYHYKQRVRVRRLDH